jgi:transposase
LGIDLHRSTVVLAAVQDSGEVTEPKKLECRATDRIIKHVRHVKPFRAVIEATSTYRWLYDLLSQVGTVLLAHPARLRLMIQRRAKTDKLNCQLLANLLRINRIPLAYIPPIPFQQMRDITRHRARLVRGQSQTKIGLRALLARGPRVFSRRNALGFLQDLSEV